MKLSIRTKLMGGFAIILITLAIVGWWGVIGMSEINDALNEINITQFVPTRTIASANIALIAWNRGILNHVLADSTQMKDEYERIMLKQKTIVIERLQALSKMEQLSEQGKRLVRKLQMNFDRSGLIRDRVVVLSREGKKGEARELVWTDLRPIIDEMAANMTYFPYVQERQLEKTMNATDKRYRQGLTRIVWIIMAALAASLAIGLITVRSITKPLGRLSKGIEEFKQGNLKYRVETGGTDELDQLIVALNAMAAERQRAEEALHELDHMKSEFVANISHELRTPLHSIRGFNKLMLENKVPDPETQREFLTIIDKQSKHLSKLVANLIDVSSIEANRFEIQKQRLSIGALIQSIVEGFCSLANGKGIIINVDIPARLPEVEGDEERLRQVMTNLLGNAIKFSPDGSSIIVKGKVEDNEILVQITDHGIGIPEEAMPYLFERFYRAKDSMARGGAGLGLYIAKEIVKAHGGRIWVESRVDEGSTISFTMPSSSQTGGDSLGHEDFVYRG